MTIPVQEIRLRTPRDTPVKMGGRPLAVGPSPDTRDPDVLAGLARRILAGEHPARAAVEVGLAAELGPHLVRTSHLYQAARQRVLAETPSADEQILAESKRAAVENAYKAVRVQSDLLDYSTDQKVLAHVSDSALDRVGLRAPSKTDTTIHMTFDQATLERIERMFGELEKVKAIETQFKPVFLNPVDET